VSDKSLAASDVVDGSTDWTTLGKDERHVGDGAHISMNGKSRIELVDSIRAARSQENIRWSGILD